MSDLKKLEQAWKGAESDAVSIQNEKDQAIDKVRTKYTKRQQAAVDKAAKAQKQFLDRQVAESLADRADGEQIARMLVDQGGLSEAAVKAVGISLG